MLARFERNRSPSIEGIIAMRTSSFLSIITVAAGIAGGEPGLANGLDVILDWITPHFAEGGPASSTGAA